MTQVIPALCLLGFALLCFVGFLIVSNAPEGTETDGVGFQKTDHTPKG